MKNYLATAMALALVAGVAGLGAIPFAAAVGDDCNDEFEIQDSEALGSRILLGNAEETGLEDVTAVGGKEEVTVRLDSSPDELEFGVFVNNPTTQECVEASSLNFSDCTASETLKTSQQVTEDELTCELKAPQDGTREYFFHIVNQESDRLDYTIWMSA